MLSKTPSINLYQYILENKSLRQKKIFYQAVSLVITLVAYTSFHIVKRPFSVVKPRLAPTCNATKINDKCFPWKPFDNPETSTDLFGMLDFVFLTAYALSMFISGPIAEHTNLRVYLSVGMISTGVVSAIFGLAYYFDIHSLYFFFLMQVLAGIFQSTGNNYYKTSDDLRWFLLFSEATVHRCCSKYLLLTISQNSQENTYVAVWFLIKSQVTLKK